MHMRCPACGYRVKSKVSYVRHSEDATYRRRTCSHCNTQYISTETASLHTKIPKDVNHVYRKPKGEPPVVIETEPKKFKTHHLSDIWRK